MQNTKCTGYILVSKVTHARFLPTAASHAFSYPTVALLLPLNALEEQELDLCRGFFFGYGSIWGRLTGIRPSAYLHDYDFTSPGGGNSSARLTIARKLKDTLKRYGHENSSARLTIARKLKDTLKRYGHDPEELEDAWMLTMPSYFGFEGINPLTVYYCYKKDDPHLWIVVLEVHNTFGERHVYVLKTGSDSEDKDVPPAFTHSWTFPRQFHVSPFNDRSGFYKCSIVEPWRHPSLPPSEKSASLNDRPQRHPTVQIHLYTSHPSKLKLTATLRPTSATPLTSYNLLSALLRFPLLLFLSFPRIAYQAFKLHYIKRLDVYARPEPRAVTASVENVLCAETSTSTRNPVEPLDGLSELGTGGGMGWQPEGMLERYARRITEAYLRHQAQTQQIRITLVPTNSGVKRCDFLPSNIRGNTNPTKHITITFRSSRFFVILLTSPSPQHAMILARSEGILGISDSDLFARVLSRTEMMQPVGLTKYICCLAQKFRLSPIPSSLHPPHFPSTIPSIHPLDVPTESRASTLIRSLCNVFLIFITLLLTRLEETVFSALHARFVPGDESWLAWARAQSLWVKESSGTGGEKKGNINGIRQEFGSTYRL